MTNKIPQGEAILQLIWEFPPVEGGITENPLHRDGYFLKYSKVFETPQKFLRVYPQGGGQSPLPRISTRADKSA